MSFEGSNGGDAEERLAEKRVNRRFGHRFQSLHLTRRSKIEALEEEEDEEEDRDDDEDERSDDGDGDDTRKDEENHHQHVFE